MSNANGAPRVALIVDHPQRDLPGLLLVAHALSANGVTCHLVPMNLQDREVFALAPDYVLLNYARVNNCGFAERLGEAGIRYGVLDTEGGVWDTVESYTELLWKSAPVREQARGVCMWGRVLARHVVNEGLFSKDQVTVTGCARFDFYDPRWKAVLDGFWDWDQPERTKGAQRPRVLVNTNFSVVNPRFTTRDQSIEWCHRNYGWSYERIRRITETEEEAIRRTLALVRSLSADYPGYDIVVRPHPFENPEPYREGLRDCPNVWINDRGPVQPQINNATVVIQRSCTTAIEAVAGGVPTLSPLWVPAPYFMPIAEAVSIPCPEYSDLRQSLETIVAGQYVANRYLVESAQLVISDWFYQIDGLSHRRVGETIMANVPAKREVDERQCVRLLYEKTQRATWDARLASQLRSTIGLSPDWSFRRWRNVPALGWTRTAKHIDVNEVRELSRRIDGVDQFGGSLQIALARESGDYLRPYHGHSITVRSMTDREGASRRHSRNGSAVSQPAGFLQRSAPAVPRQAGSSSSSDADPARREAMTTAPGGYRVPVERAKSPLADDRDHRVTVVAEYLNRPNGADRVGLEIVNALLASERAITVVTREGSDSHENERVRWVSPPIAGTFPHHQLTRWPRRVAGWMVRRAGDAVRLRRLRKAASGILVVNGFANTDSAEWANGLPFRARLLVVHDSPKKYRLPGEPPIERAVAKMSGFGYFVVPSERVAGQWRVFAPLARKKFFVVPNCCNEAPVKAMLQRDRAEVRAELGWGSGPTVACIGRIQYLKGQDVLVEAAARLKSSAPELRFAFVGHPKGAEGEEYLRDLEDRAAQAGITDRIVFHGFRDDALKCLYAADAVVIPSRSEVMPLTALEAMALGTPVIASAVGGLPELVEDDVTGWLFPVGDAAALAERLRRVVSDASRLRSFGDGGKERYWNRFSSRQFAAQYLAALSQVSADIAGNSI